jgi:hypothetical protein
VTKYVGVNACHKLCITECICWMICRRKKKQVTKNIKFTMFFQTKFSGKLLFCSSGIWQVAIG